MLPLSLYIHVPWCIRKCPYCDFNSHKSPQQLPEEQYIAALIADLQQDLRDFAARPIQSIFIGGGTPSLLSATAYEKLFHQLRHLLPFTAEIEITLEANPGTVEQARFRDYRAIGINRLSLGIQSFNAHYLERLGRIHDDKQAHQAIITAREAGFDNINLDLMHSLPGQTLTEGLLDLQTALNYKPEHLSWYQLTLEPNTLFYKTRPTLPADDDIAALEMAGFALLNEHGYQRYEISAFCQTDKMARHNLNYWLFGDYFGIGAGAHGKITVVDKIYRTQKYRQPVDYLNAQKPYRTHLQHQQENDVLFEFMLNTSRLAQPIDHTLFFERTGLNFELLMPKLRLAEEKGLIKLTPHQWQVTAFGRQFTNDLQALFLPS